MGEVIFVRLSQDLRGPGPELEIRTGASTRGNDELAVVLGASYNPSHDGADFRLLVENVTLTCPSQFKSFDPPVKLSKEEYTRLKEYYKPSPSPVTKVDQSLITFDSCSEEVDQSITLDSCSEGDDDDDNWEDNMDPISLQSNAPPILEQNQTCHV